MRPTADTAAAPAPDTGSAPGGLDAMPAPRARVEALRAELDRRGLDGFLVPRNDAFLGEYVPAASERLRWLTGFAGSAGQAAVARDAAAIFVDGRYTLQVRDQVDTEIFTPRHVSREPLGDWIGERFDAGARLGLDPWLHRRAEVVRLRRAAEAAGAELVMVEGNPIDAVWTDRPAPPKAPVRPHPLDVSGEASADKRARLAADLAGRDVAAAVITMSDSVAWLLNIRGGDVPNCPVALSFAVLHADGSVDWFVDADKLTEEARATLDDGVRLKAPDDFPAELGALGAGGARVQADPNGTVEAVFAALEAGGGTVVEGADPCLLPKACKNETELNGARTAHRRDGVALTRFLAGLAADAAGGGLSELDVVARLHALRAEGDRFRGPSFDTIAGYGPNGAVVHYHATPATSRTIAPGSLLLVDSGGQYDEGTTDVTRTVAIGTPTDEMRARFTLVLKGHIAVATARFPAGVAGSQLDPLARAALWAHGLDYDHGTGHGVGSFLNVHEGPQRISKTGGDVALQAGMIVSNEPGYYKAEAYGIRIENLVAVVPVDDPPEGAEAEMLAMETLTLAPIDRNLVEPALLTEAERFWLDAYHARVLSEIGPLVDDDTARWLMAACAPLGEGG